MNKILYFCYVELSDGEYREDYNEHAKRIASLLNNISDEDSFNPQENDVYISGISKITKQTIIDLIPKYLEKQKKAKRLLKEHNERSANCQKSYEEKVDNFRNSLKKSIFEKLLKIEKYLDSNSNINEENLMLCMNEIEIILKDLDSFMAFGLKFSDGEREWSIDKTKEFAKDLLEIIEEKIQALQMA